MVDAPSWVDAARAGLLEPAVRPTPEGALAGEALPRGKFFVPMQTSGRDRISDWAALLEQGAGRRSPHVLPGCPLADLIEARIVPTGVTDRG